MSSINLQKGDSIDLTKSNPNVKKFGIGLGWDEATGNNKYDFDLDVSAFILGSSGKRLSNSHFIFYNNLISPCGSVEHTGDNLTGAGTGDSETLYVDFSKIGDSATEIKFVVTIHESEERKQNFGMMRNSYIRVYDLDTKKEIMKYELDEDFSIETALEFGSLYRNGKEWSFKAIGQGKVGDLQSFVDQY